MEVFQDMRIERGTERNLAHTTRLDVSAKGEDRAIPLFTCEVTGDEAGEGMLVAIHVLGRRYRLGTLTAMGVEIDDRAAVFPRLDEALGGKLSAALRGGEDASCGDRIADKILPPPSAGGGQR